MAIYKLTQAVGAGIAYALTSAGVDGTVQFALNWGLVLLSLVVARKST